MDADIKKTVGKMAQLARLEFPPEYLEKFSAKVKSVLAYVEELNAVDTEGLTPTSHAVDTKPRLRADNAVAFDNADEILSNAPLKGRGPNGAFRPERDRKFIQVPRVIDSE